MDRRRSHRPFRSAARVVARRRGLQSILLHRIAKEEEGKQRISRWVSSETAPREVREASTAKRRRMWTDGREARLLQTSFSKKKGTETCDSETQDGVEGMLRSIERGTYVDAVRIGVVEVLPAPPGDSLERFFRHVDRHLQQMDVQGMDEQSAKDERLKVIALAVASLYLFVQINVTGPTLGGTTPEYVRDLSGVEVNATEEDRKQDRKWLREQMCVDGEEMVGKIEGLQYLMLAQVLLVRQWNEDGKGNVDFRPRESLQLSSIHWWAARCLFVGQKLLSRGAASYKETILSCFQHTADGLLHAFEENHSGNFHGMAMAVKLELIQAYKFYGMVSAADALLGEVTRNLGLKIDVTGMMGRRTLHQEESKAQLVVSTQRIHSNDASEGSISEGEDEQPFTLSGGGAADENCNVYEIPQLDAEVPTTKLSSLEQVVLLEHGLLIKSKMAKDELQDWEISPYLDAVDSHKPSRLAIRVLCELQRARHESSRGRTRERALARLGQLEEALRTDKVGPEVRMRYSFSLSLPLLLHVQQELAQAYVASGLMHDAMKIFESLEIWNSLITCYALLGKKAQCEALIKERLEEEPDNPQLWCTLGDITMNLSFYQIAWERSEHRSVRSQRSLARSALRNADYESASEHFEQALQLNPIAADDWFSLGYAYLKLGFEDKALSAFSRCTQLDPEQGEAWNNVAALNIRKNRYKEAFVALTEALKQKRSNWQTWSNYTQVAAKLGNWMQVVSATFQLLELTDGKVFPAESIDKLLEALQGTHGAGSIGASEREKLLEGLGRILRNAAEKGSGGITLWRISAKYHEICGDTESSRDCLVKYIRGIQSSNWTAKEEDFQMLAQASLDLCRSYISGVESGAGKKGDLAAARLHLRSLLKLAGAEYSHAAEYQRLQEVYDQVLAMEAAC